jgi:hypothetical protein
MWERAVGVPAMRCRGPHMGFTASGLGGVELGVGQERVLRRATQPIKRDARTWTWCVQGDDKGTNLRARTRAVFTPEETVGLVVTNARTHVAKGVRPGTRLKRAKRKTRAFGKGLRVRRAYAGRAEKLVYVIRKRRVSHVAVATAEASRTPAALREYLKLAGVR